MNQCARLADGGGWRWAGRLTLGAAVLTAVTVPGAVVVEGDGDPPASSDGGVVWEWNQTATDALATSGRPVQTQQFVIAAMHVAMYDAVVAVDGGYRPYATRIDAPDGTSAEAAAAAAAHRVLVEFLPASEATFDAALDADLEEIPDGRGEIDGRSVGEATGWGTLAQRLGDGSQSGPIPPAPTPDPGVWRPTPPATVGLNPWIAVAEPFALRSNDQFRPQAPPSLDSRRYARDLDEVRRLGGADETTTERTPEQTEIARFWADQPVAQAQRALRGRAASLGWDLASTARLFAAVTTSQADAFIACWDAKFHYNYWRPWQSVPVVEAGWTPLLGTPNHPEYPSAHGCFTGALGFALAEIMGTAEIDLDVYAANINVTRHYTWRDDLLAEVGDARIWGGLHYRTSVEVGLRIGQRVVAYNLHRNFRPA